jgi:hypothetical protein
MTEAELLAESLKIAAYADARMMRRGDWESWYDGAADLTTSGANLADKQRMIVGPQMETNMSISQRAKESK